MRSLANIAPSVHLQKDKQNPNRDSEVSKIIAEALEVSYLLPGNRRPQLRPSSFPKCPILDWMKTVRYDSQGYLEEQHSFGNSYFAGVGTVVHEIIQHHIGNTQKVYGNWKCTNNKCKHGQAAMDLYDATGKCVRKGKITAKETTNNICPSCARPMHYEELEISMMGITGHVDCILVLGKNKWWVVDYKTTLKSKVYKKKLPEKKHLQQLRAYAYILKHEYGLPIQGLSLVYLPRDNPFYNYEHSERFDTEKLERRALKVLKTEKSKWNSLEKTLETNNIEHIIKAKPCNCREDYYEKMDFYNKCPMLPFCFTNKLPTILENYKAGHDQGILDYMTTFDDLVQVVTSREYEAKIKSCKSRSKRRSRIGAKKRKNTSRV